MKFKDILTSAPALMEFGRLLQSIQSVWHDPETTREEKRKILNDLVNNLSQKTFDNSKVLEQLFQIINHDESECKLFPSAEAQVESILVWLPRMTEHRELLYKEIEKSRKQFNLTV